ncbi:methionine--tRNA ligase [candidate division TA06 bacterium]|uniref:Methionine--tRNA ligase n=1 Tax=candidate division TA06 bacterium TaxID=2250710 RepID=A0A660S9U8_UNCT6|nr:MAG: methionine--tRNA ligase [candidate division TA06 bacterium]
MKKVLVTSALPYANGPLHIGHIAGAYLPADIYTRYNRQKGVNVIHIGGTDEHGIAVTIRAEQEHVSPKEVVDHYHESIAEDFKRLKIDFDNFSRTSKPIHKKMSQDFFLKIYNRGLIEKREGEQLYCPHCKRFLADRYVEGECPYCHYENARGDQCENCGKWLEPTSLINPRCKICGTTPIVKKTSHWYFKLDKMQEQLEKWLASKNTWKSNVKSFTKGWFNEGLRPRAITRDIEWGIPVPLEEAKGKVLYVWFDAPIGYISSTIEWAEKQGKPDLWKDYWYDNDTKLVHFIGKDNIVFHAIVWPAMLMAYNDGIILPSEIPANEFLNIETKKISTSRNWAIWVHDFLDVFPPDFLRYYLAANAPENSDMDFTWKDFQAKINGELADILGNLVNRTYVFTKKYFDGKIPSPGDYDEDDRKIIKLIENAPDSVGKLLDNFHVRQATFQIMNLAREGNRYFDYKKPWNLIKSDKTKCGTTLYVLANLLNSIAILFSPILPDGMKKIKEALGNNDLHWNNAGKLSIKPGSEFGNPGILYKKIDDKTIRREEDKLMDENKTNETDMKNKEKNTEKKEYVKIDDVLKLGLKVAEILEAERVENTDKLIKMKIKIGEEERQIIAGIAMSYSPDEIIGKKIVVVSNMKPAKIRGIESNGMLLAASNGATLSLITVDREIDSGSSIK